MRITTPCTLVGLLATACADDTRPVELRVALRIDGAAACATAGRVGTSGAHARLTEARLYLAAPALITPAGALAPVTLTGAATADDVALVELAGDDGACVDEVAVRGAVAADATAGIRFELGLPRAFDAPEALAAAPALDSPAMRRGDVARLYYARLAVVTATGAPYELWLGASGCEPPAAACAVDNRATVVLFGDVDTARLTLDLARLWRDVDLTAAPAGPDASRGCHVAPGDPECPPVLARLGLDGAGRPTGGQDAFAMEAQ